MGTDNDTEINTLSDYLIQMFRDDGIDDDGIDDRLAEIAYHLKTGHIARMKKDKCKH